MLLVIIIFLEMYLYVFPVRPVPIAALISQLCLHPHYLGGRDETADAGNMEEYSEQYRKKITERINEQPEAYQQQPCDKNGRCYAF